MEKEKGFIHADIEDKEDSIGIDITIKNLDIFMAAAGLKGILDALSEHNKSPPCLHGQRRPAMPLAINTLPRR